MKNVDITKQTYGDRIEKSPPFAKDIVVVFADDVSVETMRKFQEGKDWTESMLKEVILDWNLYEGEEKLPISLEGLDRIKSIKLRNWIITTMGEIMIDSLSFVKKK